MNKAIYLLLTVFIFTANAEQNFSYQCVEANGKNNTLTLSQGSGTFLGENFVRYSPTPDLEGTPLPGRAYFKAMQYDHYFSVPDSTLEGEAKGVLLMDSLLRYFPGENEVILRCKIKASN